MPDILSSPGFMLASKSFKEVNLQAMFEGTSTANLSLPQNSCLQSHYSTSNHARLPSVRFDIDSICCFPGSLGFARRGIKWYPKAHPVLNLKADIHLSLGVSRYNSQGNLVTKSTPLHKIPHYCFGTVAGPIESLLVFIFFPDLHSESDHKHTSYLSKRDQQLWLDAVLLPAIQQTVNTLLSYPTYLLLKML
jgi:hypothetical protein